MLQELVRADEAATQMIQLEEQNKSWLAAQLFSVQ